MSRTHRLSLMRVKHLMNTSCNQSIQRPEPWSGLAPPRGRQSSISSYFSCATCFSFGFPPFSLHLSLSLSRPPSLSQEVYCKDGEGRFLSGEPPPSLSLFLVYLPITAPDDPLSSSIRFMVNEKKNALVCYISPAVHGMVDLSAPLIRSQESLK